MATSKQFCEELRKRDTFILRVSTDSNRNFMAFKEERYLDMAIHTYLMDTCAPPVSRTMCGGRPIKCAATFIPKLLLSVPLASVAHLSIMEVAPGIPLKHYLNIRRKQNIPLSLFWAIYDAVVSLWARGISHADLHANNIFVHEKKRNFKITIIDFDRSVLLPSEIQAQVGTHSNISKTWTSYMQNHVFNIVKRRRYVGMHSEAHLLAKLYWDHLKENDRIQVAHTCTENGKQTTTNHQQPLPYKSILAGFFKRLSLS
jgi:hypothetical protein